MKVRHRSVLMLAGYLLAIVSGTFLPILASPARAASPADSYIWYYPIGTNNVTALSKAIDGGDEHADIFNSTYVYVKDGPFGSKPFQLQFNPDHSDCAQKDTKGFSCNNDYGGQDKNLFEYTGKYSCLNGDISPDKTGGYYEVEFDAGMHLNRALSSTFPDQDRVELQALTVYTLKYHHPTDATHPAQVDTLDSTSSLPANCRPPRVDGGFQRGTTHGVDVNLQIKNYQHDPDGNKSVWGDLDGTTGNSGSGSGANGGEGTSEAGGGDCGGVWMGWLFCQAIHGASDAVGWIETHFITPFLDVKPLSFENNSDTNPQYAVWNSLRNLANGFFVIIFLVFIFATTLRINVNAYTIKKMLPKLVAAAILVQFSYLLMSLAIDITNVFGRGLFDLAGAVLPKLSGSDVNSGSGILGLAGAVTGAAALAIGAITGTLFVVIAGAFLGALAVFFTLIFRQILIIMLIVLAPFAIAAWVLPNTEKFFKTWLNLLVKALLMYPLIVLLFAAGRLFAVAAGASENEFSLAPVFELVGLVAPLFLIPFTFKFAGSAMAAGAGMIAGRASGVGKGLKESDMAKNFLKERQLKNVDRLGKAAGTRPGQFLLSKAPFGTQARFARQQTGNYNELKKRFEDSGTTTADLMNFLSGDLDKISPQGRYLKGLTGNSSAIGAASNMLAEKGLWDQTHLAKLNANSNFNDAEKDRIRDYALSGKGFGETFKKNRVLALANRESIVMGANGKGTIDTTLLTTGARSAIRGAAGAVSAQEMSNFNDKGTELLGAAGADGIGQVSASTIENLTSNPRLRANMTDNQRKAVYEAVTKNQPRIDADMRSKISTLNTELSALTPGTTKYTDKKAEVDKATNELNRFVGTGGVVDKTTTTINPDGTPV
ncbi:MAG TPA: hypothetical protein VLF21_00470 [Candidatus Saccharimonadales bacterium]|nr:hypothetical protein [Candidatus Saccharimonadales bacterium]